MTLHVTTQKYLQLLNLLSTKSTEKLYNMLYTTICWKGIGNDDIFICACICLTNQWMLKKLIKTHTYLRDGEYETYRGGNGMSLLINPLIFKMSECSHNIFKFIIPFKRK